MPELLQLPPELLARIVEFVAVNAPTPRDHYHYGYDDENKYKAINDPTFSNRGHPYDRLAVTPRPDITSLRNLRLASSHFSIICATHLYACVRLLPFEESATRYDNILSTTNLSRHVQKVIFQTRMVPGGSTSSWARQCPGPDDDYTEPHPFFMDALGQVGRFSNLTHAEIVFSITCSGPSALWGDETENVEFREEVLSAFYAGLNHSEHPAAKVYNLGIKNLQDITPQALIDGTDVEDNGFAENFKKVMSRITHFSLQVATEDDEAAPENMLHIPESHDFFGHELQTYWLGPMAENLVYLKLYASELYFGMYPGCNLPRFPKLRMLLLGNLSIVNDDQIDWILSHADTLEQLTLDDAVIAVGAEFLEHKVDVINRRVIYSPLKVESGRPRYQAERTDISARKWLWPTRWHHIFDQLQRGLPKLKHFVFGHGNWDDNAAFDEADILTCEPKDGRYQYFDEGTGPSNWLDADSSTNKAYNDWEEDKNDVVYHPQCDEEDWQALKDMIHKLEKRR
ncbi:hypothetical protein KCU65_g5568, partial [Aureobasidium melanogenum]